MSDYGNLPAIRSISLGDEPLFADVGSGTRSEERRLADGTVVTATVEDGKIIGYTARDKNGKSLEVVRLRMTSGHPPDYRDDSASVLENCWFCFCDDNHCQCTPEPCPEL
jgi:hypothetical protein